MFHKLGLFRFVTDYANPIPALEAALSAHGIVNDSLIVLPEAFNIGRDYLDSETQMRRDPAILSDLQSVAKEHSVTFVAGLIIDQPDGPNAPAKPFSSSYLIDSTRSTLLCRKMCDDRTGNYSPCQTDFDVNNPLCYTDVLIASLLCMDSADHPDTREREQRLIAHLGAEPCQQRIVCIPANMSRDWGPKEISKRWPGVYFILANSRRWGCPSLIALGDTILFEDERADDNNVVFLATLDHESDLN